MALRKIPKKKGKYKDIRYNKSCTCPFCETSICYISFYIDSDMRLTWDFGRNTDVCKSEVSYNNVWCNCLECNRPVYFPPNINSNSDFLCIQMSSFFGWIGSGKNICLVIDTTNNKAICNILTKNGSETYPIDETIIINLSKNKDLLLEYQSKNEEAFVYDSNNYYFNIFFKEKQNTVSFQSPYMKNHPLFNDLVTLILKIHNFPLY